MLLKQTTLGFVGDSYFGCPSPGRAISSGFPENTFRGSPEPVSDVPRRSNQASPPPL